MNIKYKLGIACAVAMLLTAGIVQALDNIGTGGTITYTDAGGSLVVSPTLGGDVIHTFTNSGAYSNSCAVTAQVLVVGGGGGGGQTIGGGGGGGGFVTNYAYAVTAGTYNVTMGVGGTGIPGSASYGIDGGAKGSNSIFGTIIAYGGGGGGSFNHTTTWNSDGASGGGRGAGTSAAASAYTNTQGNAGGTTANNLNGGAGGGGAGTVGTNGVNSTTAGGKGGMGKSCDFSGTLVNYAGGGGGGSRNNGSYGPGGAGGLGGGGAGSNRVGNAGIANTGGGGGAGGFEGNVSFGGGNGGSGIVIVRYPYDPGSLSVAVTAPANSQMLFAGSSVSATATVANGAAPYTVTFHTNYNGGSYDTAGTTNASTYTMNWGTLAVGTYGVYATVTDNASSNAASSTNTFTVMVPSSNATLTNLVSSAGAYSPAFASNTVSYAQSVSNAVSSLTVTPTAADSYATIRVNGAIVASGSASASISLSVGVNVITNQVVSQDMTATNTYMLTITRPRASTSLYWSGNGSTQGGNGTWDLAGTRWGTSAGGLFSNAWDNVYNDTAIFGGTAGTVTLGSDITVGGLQFTVSGYTIGGPYRLTFGGASGLTNNIGSITFNGGVCVSNTGPVQVGFQSSGNSMTFSNATVVVSGALYVAYFTAGGSVASNNTMTVGNQGTLRALGGNGIRVGTGDGGVGASGRLTGNSLVITNEGYVSGGMLTIGYNYYGVVAGSASNGVLVADGGTLVTAGATFGGNGSTGVLDDYIRVIGGSATSTWNVGNTGIAFGQAANITVDGGGVAGGAVVTNVASFSISYPGASILVTNGGRWFLNNTTLMVGSGANLGTLTIGAGGVMTNVTDVTIGLNSACSNQVVVAGAGAQLSSGGTLWVGSGNGAKSNSVLIANGGLVSAAGLILGDSPAYVGGTLASDNSVTITNGGQLYTTGVSYVGKGNGAGLGTQSYNNRVTIGSNSLWNAGGAALYVGYNPVANAYSQGATGNVLTVSSGGVVTNAGLITVGYGGAPVGRAPGVFNNAMIVTNAQIWSSGLTIGNGTAGGTGSHSNSVTLWNGSTWNLGGSNLTVGSGIATGNVLVVNAGVLTNIAVLTVKATNSLTLGAGGLIYAGAVTNAGTMAVSLDMMVSPGCGCLFVTNNLNLNNARLDVSPNGTLGDTYVIASYGTLTGAFAATNGLPENCTLDMNYMGRKQVAIVAPTAVSGTIYYLR